MGIPGAAPARLGQYELLARLATGGMGEIFLARLEGAAGFEKLFVIKRILPHLADDLRFRAMLIGEARIASMMTHANICQVHQLGETDGQLYIVMEYLEGITVLPLLRKLSKDGGALDLGFVSGVTQQATDGLHYAHELRDRGGDYLGIVHRDVTPSNLFLTDSGVVKVLDFGIAKVKDASAHTQTGTVKGKYAYMSPEQLRGGAVDRRADVFALGVVVYEMLALRRLFQRKTDYLTFRAVMEQPIADVRHYRPDCPAALAGALSRALDREPEQRFETARQFGTAVLDAVTGITRPWTQGEISDFVATNFAEDITRRGAQIASAVRSGAAHQTMPLISTPDAEAETEIGEAASEFSPVDSEVSVPRADGRRGWTEQQAAFSEPTASAPNLDALRAVPSVVSQQHQQPIVVVNPRRSLLWPFVAFAMVAVAAGALFLVWRQMQNQQPTSIVITNGSDSRVTEAGSNVVVVGPNLPASASQAEPDRSPVPPAGEGHGRAAAESRPGPTGKTATKVLADPFSEVVHAKEPAVNRCPIEHGTLAPGTSVDIVVAPDGHAKTVTIHPDRVDATPFGACVKKLFRETTFPRGDRDHSLVVNLGPRAHRRRGSVRSTQRRASGEGRALTRAQM